MGFPPLGLARSELDEVNEMAGAWVSEVITIEFINLQQ
jgi:hypothetical protein